MPWRAKGRSTRPRATSAARGYGAAWRRLRAQVLREQPVCAVDTCDRPATDVHHLVAKARGGTDDRRNLIGLCHKHHSSVTAKVDGGFGN